MKYKNFKGAKMENKEVILVVDDTQANVDILVELLGDYDVVVALDGKSALEALEYDDVDLILLDIMMPIMDGFEVCKKIKLNPKTEPIPVIFLTAKTDDASIQRGFELGGADYVTKPFRPIELLSRVKTQLNLVKHQKGQIEKNKFLALSELMENIAHQWRQPLSVISTSSSGMLMQKEMDILTDENLVNFCNTITQQAQYLSSTIDNIKHLTDKSHEKTKINIYHFFNEDIPYIFNQNNIDDIKYMIDIDQNIDIYGSCGNFIQVIEHILINSKEFLKQKDLKLIYITVKKNLKNEAIIEIYDNAGGVDDGIVDKIFEPYFTTKHKSQERGLGLYAVRSIVIESFNGKLNVSNKEFKYNNTIQKGFNIEITIPTT